MPKPPSDLDDLIQETFAAPLKEAGFENVRPRKWVRSVRSHIRQLVTINALKGAIYSVCWGVSLDFVPLYRSNKFRWKQTPLGCAYDLCIDPIDLGHRWSSFVFNPGVQTSTRFDLRQVADVSLTSALKDFDRAQTLLEVDHLYAERKRMRFVRFSLENYVQSYLGWGLTLHVLGRESEAESNLALFCARHGASPNDRMLLVAKEQARLLQAPHLK
jgi:hypothetical protein